MITCKSSLRHVKEYVVNYIQNVGKEIEVEILVLMLSVLGILSHNLYYELEDVDREKPIITVMLAINNAVILLINIDSSWQEVKAVFYDDIDIYYF